MIIALMCSVSLSGNYGFFNLLTMHWRSRASTMHLYTRSRQIVCCLICLSVSSTRDRVVRSAVGLPWLPPLSSFH